MGLLSKKEYISFGFLTKRVRTKAWRLAELGSKILLTRKGVAFAQMRMEAKVIADWFGLSLADL